MEQREIILKIKENFSKSEVKVFDEKQFSVFADKDDIVRILSFMQMIGFQQLAIISAVDWIDEKKFELVYNLFSYTHIQQVLVKTKIERDNPKIQSVMNLWEVAQMYERDVHEFFGIEFSGNDDMRPLILHNWKDKPPMRKDFDSLKYSNEIYGTFKKSEEV
ncbi:MAG: NADH-quinone oxidoreductase subunit C [bacterium]|nr:NADH-quinone oxidoreductase subunit C [bacterium]